MEHVDLTTAASVSKRRCCLELLPAALTTRAGVCQLRAALLGQGQGTEQPSCRLLCLARLLLAPEFWEHLPVPRPSSCMHHKGENSSSAGLVSTYCETQS